MHQDYSDHTCTEYVGREEVNELFTFDLFPTVHLTYELKGPQLVLS